MDKLLVANEKHYRELTEQAKEYGYVFAPSKTLIPFALRVCTMERKITNQMLQNYNHPNGFELALHPGDRIITALKKRRTNKRSCKIIRLEIDQETFEKIKRIGTTK